MMFALEYYNCLCQMMMLMILAFLLVLLSTLFRSSLLRMFLHFLAL